MDGWETETQWATPQKVAQTSPVADRPECSEEVLSECYRASAEGLLSEIHEVAALGAQCCEQCDRMLLECDRVLTGVAADSPPNSF